MSKHGPRAFTLIEILIAIGIFAIGFVSIASPLFVGARIQAETIDDIRVQQVRRSAEALLKAVPFDRSYVVDELTNSPSESTRDFDIDGRVYPFGDFGHLSDLEMKNRSFPDRSFPSNVPFKKRRYYWSLLVRDRDTNRARYTFDLYLVVMRRGDEAPVPEMGQMGVGGVEDLEVGDKIYPRRILRLSAKDANRFDDRWIIRPGDHVVDGYGRIFTVDVGVTGDQIPVTAPVPDPDPDVLWYVEPASSVSRNRVSSIHLLPVDVVQGPS